MLLGYNTNGFANHDLYDAIEIIAEIGYRSVAITIDHHALNPKSSLFSEQLEHVCRLLEKYRLASVIETGARYLLDPWQKHEPTLISPAAEGRRMRQEFYFHAVDCASRLGSFCVSIWSGKPHPAIPQETLWQWLEEGLLRLLDYAATRGVRVALEPEPGMLIATVDDYCKLFAKLQRGDLWLTIDVGHLHCQGEPPFAEIFPNVASQVVNIHLEDMRRGTHEHLFFGEGEIDFREIFATLLKAGYAGPVHVELSRHSHEAPEVARRAFRFLSELRETLLTLCDRPSCL